jgi:tetratricopeptide (TPR) repeat protein
MFPSSGRSFRQRMHQILAPASVCVTLLTTLISTPILADDFADASKLIRAGQFSSALGKVNAALAQRPKDAQMRFLKGLILTEQNKSADAIIIFTKLTEDFPELPEPYNNLAVLYASAGQYDTARASLEAAIRTNPTYATAHENLGDVYAKLASQAYDKALQLDSGNTSAKSKLTMVRTMVSGAPPATVPTAKATITASAKPVPTPATATSTPAVVAKLEPVKPAKQEPAPKPEPKAEAKPVAKPKPEPKEDKVANENDEVLRTLNNWAKAWSAMDVKSYLNSYASDFQTPKGESHKAWAEERRSRIEGKGRINVQIESAQVTINGNTATIKFRQIYTSDRLNAKSRKIMLMNKQGGKWHIKQERSAN